MTRQFSDFSQVERYFYYISQQLCSFDNYPKELKLMSQILMAALFIIAKTCKQPKCPLVEWISCDPFR